MESPPDNANIIKAIKRNTSAFTLLAFSPSKIPPYNKNSEIKISDLPTAVQSVLSKDFAGFKIEEASKIESAKNGNCFEAEIEKGKETFDVLFTPDGKVLSKTKVEEEKGEKD